jgi:hypothetical protein
LCSWWLRLRIFLFAAVVPAVMLLPLHKIPRWIEPWRILPTEPSRDEVTAMVRLVDRSLKGAWPLVRRGCVTRSVTLYRFLRRSGADVSLRFGIGTVDGVFEGHCWIVYRGEPLAESRDPRRYFTETWAIPS